MSEEKTAPDTASEDDVTSLKEARKRATYPVRDLQTIIDFVGKVYSQLGHTAYHSNKAIATVHGLAPESIKQHLSAGQQYKLLEIKHGIGYKTSDLFQRIFLPKNENEKRLSVIESLKSPDVYQQLFKDYEYHIVPADGVKNHFIRTFGFKEDVAVKAAQIFLDNLKDFQLLDSRGVLTSALPSKPIVPDTVELSGGDSNNENKSNINQESNERNVPARQQRSDKIIFQSEIDRDGKKTIPIYLTDDKQAVFVYPDEITEDDIELVKHQIQGILMRIQLEAKARAAKGAT